MDTIKGKNILLLYARFFEYDKIVKEKMIQRGANVDLFDARANISTFQKALLKKTDKFYKKKQIRFHSKICEKKSSKKYDYIFTNENLDIEVINNYKKTFPNATFILYLDDSVQNLREVDKTFSYYDKVLTFDRLDSQKYNIVFRPLFSNDIIKNESHKTQKEIYDICFVGTAHSDRINIIDSIKKSLTDRKIEVYLYLQSKLMYFYYYFFNREYRKFKFTFFKYKKIKMENVVDIMKKSKIILDIHHPKQSGLTMRTIESLGLNKKIITTNGDIVNYDFYDSNNIYVIDRDKPVIDNAFFEKEYKYLEDNIYQKYSIDSWINDVFGG